MTSQTLGILLMCATMAVLSVQDGVSRYLAGAHSVWMVVMLRYWVFAALALAICWRTGRLARVWRTPRRGLQTARGALMAAEICVLVASFVLLGLTESHAIFALCPLLIAALSVPVLGERLGPARWGAIGIGLVGTLIILSPGTGLFTPLALLPLASAMMWALYAVLTRLAARTDDVLTSFTWTGCVGTVLVTPMGLWAWGPMGAGDWALMGLLCLIGAAAQWMLIRTYDLAEASVVQPFAYLQLVFAAAIGVAVFNEVLRPNVAVGAAIVISAGLFAIWRARRAARDQPSSPSTATAADTRSP